MKVEIIGDQLQPLTIDARRVLILGDDGVTPLAVAVHLIRDEVAVYHFGDANFPQVLRNLGIDRRVAVTRLGAPPGPPRS